jgi:predicted nucleic acid-binding protein
LLFEYEDVLKRNQATLSLNDVEVDAVLDNLCALAEFQAVYFLWRPCLPDASDDMVLELAVAARVPCIVSFNAKDFRPASRFGIEVITPKTLLEQLEKM